MPSSEIVFWKSALHKYVHITHIDISEKLFTKIQSFNSALALQAHFLEWRLRKVNTKFVDCVMKKRFSHMCICIYTYIYIYIHTFMKISFPKHDLRPWHGHFKLDFWNGAYLVLRKSSSYIDQAGWPKELSICLPFW